MAQCKSMFTSDGVTLFCLLKEGHSGPHEHKQPPQYGYTYFWGKRKTAAQPLNLVDAKRPCPNYPGAPEYFGESCPVCGSELTTDGSFGKLMIEQALRRADEALSSGDVIKILQSYEELKNLE